MKRVLYLIMILQLVSCNIGLSRQSNVDYALWSDKSPNSQWTKITEEAVADSDLLESNPADIKDFCPQYKKLNKQQKTRFWTFLISIMAFYESGFDRQTKYIESFKDSSGESVVSRGLLQLSYESAKQKNYRCDFDEATDLHIVKINIKCSVNILSYWVSKDKQISGNGNNVLGGGRYWSVLRPKHPSFMKLQKKSNELEFCQL